MLILELCHLPLFGMLTLQLLKQQIPCIKTPLFEISRDEFCLTARALTDTGDKLLLMEKRSMALAWKIM